MEPTQPNVPPSETEQMQQQQTGTPVVLRAIAETVVVTDRGIRLHLMAVDEDGCLWERWGDDKPGVWHEVERPTR